MSKVCFQLIVFNGDYVLEPVLESIKPFGPIVVTEGPVRYWMERGFETSTDRTNEILHDLVGMESIVHGQWSEKDEMMNAAIHLIPQDTTHVWMVDADEVWEPSVLAQVIAQLDRWDSVAFKPNTFYGGFERVLTGFELRAEWIRIQRWHARAHWQTHRPPTVLDPRGVRYHDLRHWDAPITFAHYSYVFPKQVKDKVDYYESWGAGVIPNYFDQVYLRWVRGNLRQKAHVEVENKGVHEWLPARRGDCFTKEFTGKHPEPIARRMMDLTERFEEEMWWINAIHRVATRETYE